MVLMVRFLSCARVSVHFKKAYFAYFVAYIPHFCVFVIGDIYRVKREKSARKSEKLTCDLFHKSNVFDCDAFHNVACDSFHNAKIPNRTTVLTAEQTF